MRSAAAAILLSAVLFSAAPAQATGSMAKLSAVVDGNTLSVKLRGEELKIRMHGVVVPPADAERPILQRLNEESLAFLRKYLSDGWVYLEFVEDAPKKDAEGYVPAFVYRGSDATFLNEKLIAAGLALVNKKEKNEFTERWLGLQENAKGAERGVWGPFQPGDGEKIAAGGVAQGTFIGVPGSNDNRRSSNYGYVTYWILRYY
jgi:endonuclease YncB( thermonuclease family)